MGRHASGHKFVHKIRLRGSDGSIIREFVLDEREMRDGTKRRVFVPNNNIQEPELILNPPVTAQPSEETHYYESLPQSTNMTSGNQNKPDEIFGNSLNFVDGFPDFDITFF